MAIGDAYATAATYRALISKTDTAEDGEILDDLTAVTRYLERHPVITRFFTRDVAAVARTHYISDECHVSRDRRTLYVPDIASKTDFVLKRDDDRDGDFADETAWTIDTDFQLLPLNADKGPEAHPWTVIYIPTWTTKDLWSNGQHLQITSAAGWPAIPKALERATIHLTAMVRIESPRATRRIPEGIDAALDSSDEAQDIVLKLAAAYGRPVVFA